MHYPVNKKATPMWNSFIVMFSQRTPRFHNIRTTPYVRLFGTQLRAYNFGTSNELYSEYAPEPLASATTHPKLL